MSDNNDKSVGSHNAKGVGIASAPPTDGRGLPSRMEGTNPGRTKPTQGCPSPRPQPEGRPPQASGSSAASIGRRKRKAVEPRQGAGGAAGNSKRAKRAEPPSPASPMRKSATPADGGNHTQEPVESLQEADAHVNITGGPESSFNLSCSENARGHPKMPLTPFDKLEELVEMDEQYEDLIDQISAQTQELAVLEDQSKYVEGTDKIAHLGDVGRRRTEIRNLKGRQRNLSKKIDKWSQEWKDDVEQVPEDPREQLDRRSQWTHAKHLAIQNYYLEKREGLMKERKNPKTRWRDRDNARKSIDQIEKKLLQWKERLKIDMDKIDEGYRAIGIDPNPELPPHLQINLHTEVDIRAGNQVEGESSNEGAERSLVTRHGADTDV